MRVHHQPVFTVAKGICHVSCTCGEKIGSVDNTPKALPAAQWLHREHRDGAEWEESVQRLRDRGWVRA